MSRRSRLRPVRATAAALVAGWLVAACQSGPGGADGGEQSPPSVERIWQSGQCAQRTAGSRWIEDRGALERVVRAAGPRSPDADEASIPEVAFNWYRVVLIALGERPSAGYGLALPRDTLDVQGDTAELRIAVTRPAADSMQAQVVTAPCMLVAVERNGYATLEIVDSEGDRHGTLKRD